jgi:signal transduction histidine kinase
MTTTAPHRPPAMRSLSARLLVLTVAFIMLAEFLIWAPSISRFRKVYLEEHLADAHLATLALEATPNNLVEKKLERQLLAHAGAYGIMITGSGHRMLMLSDDMPPTVDITFDLRKVGFMTWLPDAFEALAQDQNRVMRVIGVPPKDTSVVVELVLDEAPMVAAMVDYSSRIFQLSIVISLLAAGLVYFSLHRLIVRPMRRITENMSAFREHPEDESRTIVASGRRDEVGIAQRELAVMQTDLRSALRQKNRLATLGAAMAKINHDLRNSLATAVLVSDRLADIDDPEVKEITPRLYTAIDRAVALCSHTLSYVSDQEAKVNRSHFHLQELIAEVGAVLRSPDGDDDGSGAAAGLAWTNDVSFDVDVRADREQLFRAISNLGRNASEAGAKNVRVDATRRGDSLFIDVTDDGPGLPARALKKLFQPFAGSARAGGTGLGLVIARDILRAHGGDVTLVETGETGTTFRLELPA